MSSLKYLYDSSWVIYIETPFILFSLKVGEGGGGQDDDNFEHNVTALEKFRKVESFLR